LLTYKCQESATATRYQTGSFLRRT